MGMDSGSDVCFGLCEFLLPPLSDAIGYLCYGLTVCMCV